MKKQYRNNKLALSSETVRMLHALEPARMAAVAGGRINLSAPTNCDCWTVSCNSCPGSVCAGCATSSL